MSMIGQQAFTLTDDVGLAIFSNGFKEQRKMFPSSSVFSAEFRVISLALFKLQSPSY